MLRDIKKKFVLTQLILLSFFAWGIGFLYLISTVLFNPVQLHWELFCFSWEAFAFGLPLIVFRPIFRPIERYVRELEGGGALTLEQVEAYHRKVLAYPFKVSLVVFFGSLIAYVLGAIQVRYFAHLPWDDVIISITCGVTSGLLWAVLDYFLLEYYLRPLTSIAIFAAPGLPRPPTQVSLKLKIFLCSVTLVVASLSFFGIVAYTRAAHTLEEQIGARLSGRMHELANLIATLPRPAQGGLSDAWWLLAAEYRVSPRGHFDIIDRAGNIVVTHPANAQQGMRRLQDEQILPSVSTTILTTSEGRLTDRVDYSKIISFVPIPGTRWKIVAFAPMRDFSPQIDQMLYAGLVGMAVALLLSLIVAFLCARSITTSLAELTRVAQLVASKHDLRQRVTFLTNDEIGVLAHAFNQMAHGLQSYAEGLEQRVAERTQQLARRTDQLEAKNQELSDFLYVASHDLRAPLINLSGFSHVLQQNMESLDGMMAHVTGNGNGASRQSPAAAQWPQLKQEIAESVDFILRSTGKMDALVSGLLDLARIETRATVPEPIDTAALVREILDAFQFQISQKQIAVSVGRLPTVLGNPLRINQVFSNLIDNAIKYMYPHSQARIDIGCEESAEAYRFFVRDTGPGIRPEDRDKVFRLFTRLGHGGIAGEGVGLAAVRKIVEKHGGRIWVESELGHGSTFWFTLPYRTAAAEALRSTQLSA